MTGISDDIRGRFCSESRNDKIEVQSTQFLRLNPFRNFRSSLAVIYLCSMIFHHLITQLSPNILSSTLGFVFGTIWIILIPGKAAIDLLYTDKQKSIWIVIVTGILVNCLSIHCCFLISLYLGIQTNPQIVIIGINSFLVLLMVFKLDAYSPELDSVYSLIQKNHLIIGLFLIGLILRLTLSFLGDGAIAPDACLYSDYGRNLLNGQFWTNIINDNRIYNLWNGEQYCFHQCFTYLAALSFFIVAPTSSGPVPILILIGITTAGLGYEFTKQLFDERAGRIAASIILILPIFVFHSSFAYGPEISSLMMILGGLIILLQNNDRKSYLIGGIMFALADLIWYSNFLLFITALPFFIILTKRTTYKESLFAIISAALVVGTRVFFIYTDVYLILLVLFLMLITSAWILWKESEMRGYSLFLLAIVILELIWRGAIQLSHGSNLILKAPTNMFALLQASNPQVSIFLSQITLELILGFLVFFTLHLTPFLLLAAIVSPFVSSHKNNAFACLAIILIGSSGTLYLFASLSSTKDVLLQDYFYSDSRFFLSIIVFGIVAASGTLSEVLSRNTSISSTNFRRFFVPKRIKVTMTILLLLCMMPTYSIIPTGVTSISYEDRFGWKGLPDLILNITGPDDLILCERATEMAWLTGRRTVYPLFNFRASLPASLEKIGILFNRHSPDYFLIDGYTVARWQSLYEVLYTPLMVGGSMPVLVRNLNPSTTSVEIQSIELEVQNAENQNGDYARLFSLKEFNYSQQKEIELFSQGWAASEGGVILNQSGKAMLIIGNDANYTNSWRPNGFDLGLDTDSGFALIEVDNHSASVARISFYDENGIHIGNAALLNDNRYIFILGHVTLGDVRIVIEGEENGYIIVEQFQIWDRE